MVEVDLEMEMGGGRVEGRGTREGGRMRVKRRSLSLSKGVDWVADDR